MVSALFLCILMMQALRYHSVHGFVQVLCKSCARDFSFGDKYLRKISISFPSFLAIV